MVVAAEKREKGGIPWWVILLQGILAIIIGFFFLTAPAQTAVVFAQFLGIYWLISGIFAIVSIFIDSSGWGWKLISGVLGIVAGFIILEHPLWSPLIIGGTFILVLGIQGLIIGVINLIQAFRGGGWGIGILGVLSMVFGLILLLNVPLATLGLPWILGIFGIVGGIAAIIAAFRWR